MTLMLSQSEATVAAVIPTSGRESVVDAVRSALGQSRPPDVVVVATAERNLARVRELLADHIDNIQIEVTNIDKPTGGFLRKLGTDSIDCDWYAFLDDDDQWLPTKLGRQLVYAEECGLDVASSSLLVSGPDSVGDKPIPGTTYSEGDSVSEYLFAGRTLRVDRPLLHTSTLLVSREAIEEVNWDPGLSVHQDWDLVLRLDDAGFKIGQSRDPLTHVATGTSGSMSATNKWASSLEWWKNSKHLMSDRSSADFLYSQVLRYALRERSREGIQSVMLAAKRSCRPSWSAILIGLTGCAPRSVFEKAMVRDARTR